MPIGFPFSEKRAQRVLVQDQGNSISERTPSAASNVRVPTASTSALRTASSSGRPGGSTSSQAGSKSGLGGVSFESAAKGGGGLIIGGPEDEFADFDLASFADRSFEDTSVPTLSGMSWRGRRPRGCPLFGDFGSPGNAVIDSLDNLESSMPSSRPQTSSLVPIGSPGSPSQGDSRPGTGVLNLQFTEPTHGVFRSVLKPPNVDAPRYLDLTKVTGRPMVKGQIRAYIPPMSAPFSATLASAIQERREDRERVCSPAISTLLRDSERSKMSQSMTSLGEFSSRPCTSTDRPWTSTDTFVSNASEAVALRVPEYFLPIVAQLKLCAKAALPKVKAKLNRSATSMSKTSKSGSAPQLIDKGSKRQYSDSAPALMKDLKMLRRAGISAFAEDENANSAGKADGTFMDMCMCDFHDTPDTLRNGIQILEEQLVAAVNHGAAQHPTINVSRKALGVVKRKLELLTPLVKQLEGLEAVIKDPGVQVMVDTVLNGGDPEALYGHAFGCRDILIDNIHHHPPGRPQDVPGVDRHKDHFLKTFGLPAEHDTVLRVRSIIKNEAAHAAELAVEMAQALVFQAAERQDPNPKSVEAEAISRLETLLDGLGTHEDHPALTKVGRCKEAGRAAAVLRYAQSLTPVPIGKPGLAFTAAQCVEEEVAEAIEWGVFDDHPDIMKAATVGHHLRGEGILRVAKNTVHSMGNRLGDAEAAAVKIEDAIKEAIKAGVPALTSELEEARKVALHAREVEGLKKREFNAEKRKKDAAEKAAAAAAIS